VEDNNMAEATVNYTTIVNGEKTSNKKIFKGTKAEVEAQLKQFENATVKTTGEETEITIEKTAIRK